VLGNNGRYQSLSKFPRVSQDISLRVQTTTTYADLEQAMRASLVARKPTDTEFTITPLDIYQEVGAGVKHVAFRITIVSYTKTLKADTVNNLLDTVAADLSQSLQAERL
jgi:phenylalanyl-tRNA synthetase beta subunit